MRCFRLAPKGGRASKKLDNRMSSEQYITHGPFVNSVRVGKKVLFLCALVTLVLANTGCESRLPLPETAMSKVDTYLRSAPESRPDNILGTLEKGTYFRVHNCTTGTKPWWCWVATIGENPRRLGWIRQLQLGTLRGRRVKPDEFRWVDPDSSWKLLARKPAKVRGTKVFRVVAHVKGVVLSGEHYQRGAVLQRQLTGRGWALITKNGDLHHLTRPLTWARGLEFNWDVANDIATGKDLSDQIFKRYFHFIIRALSASSWFSWFVFFLLILYSAAVGFDRELLIIAILAGFILALPLIFFGEIQGEYYRAYLVRIDMYNDYFEPHRIAEGQFRSFQPNFTSKYSFDHSTTYKVFNIIYVPYFILVHLLVAVTIPFAASTIHYLFVPHPIEKHIPRDPRKTANIEGVLKDVPDLDTETSMPAWKGRSRARRLQRVKELLKRQNDMLEHLIRRERKRKGLDDYESL